MENNSNAIAEIQKKYAGCNLLMPAATEVQLNPFYKITVMEVTADLSENSGDIFKVGSVKTGTTQQGKDIWEETYSPAKPLLMKIAAAAGIQFDPDHTYGTKIDANTYKAKAYGAMRMPDGTGKTHADEKVICLDDEEANYRVEFMDKCTSRNSKKFSRSFTAIQLVIVFCSLFSAFTVDIVSGFRRVCSHLFFPPFRLNFN